METVTTTDFSSRFARCRRIVLNLVVETKNYLMETELSMKLHNVIQQKKSAFIDTHVTRFKDFGQKIWTKGLEICTGTLKETSFYKKTTTYVISKYEVICQKYDIDGVYQLFKGKTVQHSKTVLTYLVGFLFIPKVDSLEDDDDSSSEEFSEEEAEPCEEDPNELSHLDILEAVFGESDTDDPDYLCEDSGSTDSLEYLSTDEEPEEGTAKPLPGQTGEIKMMEMKYDRETTQCESTKEL